jgi:hypothetical protein
VENFKTLDDLDSDETPHERHAVGKGWVVPPPKKKKKNSFYGTNYKNYKISYMYKM